jgi:hypothetical protein
MRTIDVLQSARDYFIDGIYWGDDEEGVRRYLRAKGIAPDEIAKAMEGVAQAGRYIIQQEA